MFWGPALPVVAAIIILIVILSQGYIKAPPDQVYIISGSSKKPRYLIGKAGIRIPFFERLDKLSLKMLSVDVNTTKTIPTKDYINIMVDSVAVIKISNTDDGLAKAAENFLNRDSEYINVMVSSVLEGNLREIIGGMKLTEIMNDRKAFAALVQDNASTDMSNMGLEIVSFNIQNIDDDGLGVIENLGIANTVSIRKEAEISRANAEKEIAVAQANANKVANDARIVSETAIAEQNNALALKQAALKAEADTETAKADAAMSIEAQRQQKAINTEQVNAEIAKADREAELKMKEVAVKEQELAASIRKQADAERYAAEQKAQADLVTKQKQSEAELYAARKQAEGIKARGEAEAEAARAKGIAEAEAMDKKAEALKKYGQAALAQQIINVLPDIIAAAAKPIEGIDSINIYSATGGTAGTGADSSDGAGAPTSSISAIAPQSIKAAFDMVKSVTGVDLSDVMRAETYDAKVNKHFTINADAASQKTLANAVEKIVGESNTSKVDTQVDNAQVDTDTSASHTSSAQGNASGTPTDKNS